MQCLAYFETSAMKAINIDDVFYSVASAALTQAQLEPRNSVKLQELPRERHKSDAGADARKLFTEPEKK